MFGFGKKDEKKADNDRKSVRQLTKEERIQVEDMLDNGWLAREIADDLNIPIEAVSRAKDIWRRGTPIQPQKTEETDDIKQGKLEIELLKLADQKAELEHRRALREIDRELALAKKEEALAEMQEGEYEQYAEAAQSPDDMFKLLLMQTFMGNRNAGNSTPQNTQPQANISPQQETPVKSPVNEPVPQSLADVKQGIKDGKFNEEQVIQGALKMGFTEKQARKFYAGAKK